MRCHYRGVIHEYVGFFVLLLKRVKAKKYETREMFIRDVSLLVRNSEQYNGAKSVLTDTAKKMLDLCLQRIAEVWLPSISIGQTKSIFGRYS